MIGSTAYAYGSRLGQGYTEELMLYLTERLLNGDSKPLGALLIEAKQTYYVEHGDIDHLDEKVLLPFTLYGLPMLQIGDSAVDMSIEAATVSDTVTFTTVVATTVAATTVAATTVATATESLQNIVLTLNTIPGEGQYYDYLGQIREAAGQPVQPIGQIELAAVIDGAPPRGVLLRSASYTEKQAFDPVLGQPWAIGELEVPKPSLRAMQVSGWDRAFPHQLGYFPGSSGAIDSNPLARVNLVLGAYHGDTQTERLFDGFEFEILYSASAAQQSPMIQSVVSYVVGNRSVIAARVKDDETSVARVVGLCDDAVGHYTSVELLQINGQWEGACTSVATRYAIQVVDDGGNVTTSTWRNETTERPTISSYPLYLPAVRHP